MDVPAAITQCVVMIYHLDSRNWCGIKQHFDICYVCEDHKSLRSIESFYINDLCPLELMHKEFLQYKRIKYWQRWAVHMMTSSNGNIFRATGPLCGELTGHRWIPHTKGQWRRALRFSLICFWINDWVNNRKAGDLRRHNGPYGVIIMSYRSMSAWWS